MGAIAIEAALEREDPGAGARSFRACPETLVPSSDAPSCWPSLCAQCWRRSSHRTIPTRRTSASHSSLRRGWPGRCPVTRWAPTTWAATCCHGSSGRPGSFDRGRHGRGDRCDPGGELGNAGGLFRRAGWMDVHARIAGCSDWRFHRAAGHVAVIGVIGPGLWTTSASWGARCGHIRRRLVLRGNALVAGA